MPGNPSFGRPSILVTGAYGGIGIACARLLGRAFDLVLTDFDKTRLDTVASNMAAEGYIVHDAISGDITSAATADAIIAAVKKAGRLRGLVHTAAVSSTLADWRANMHINVCGTEQLLRKIEPMVTADTVAVLIASSAGHMCPPISPEAWAVLQDCQAADFLERVEPFLPPLPGGDRGKASAAYLLSKRWMLRTCENLAPAWGKKNARIVTISPGMIWTPMGRAAAEMPEVAAMVTRAPLPRWGTPLDIANMAEFLISERAGFITGSDFRVDGGYVGQFVPTV